tara:strand:+ start:393 stop:647 length:255 start_codon:yes stop_codon:yes gene_type:complete
MCLGGGGGGGVTAAAEKAAAEERVAADETKQSTIDDRAKSKKEDISEAIDERSIKSGRRGAGKGAGRRSLFRSGSGSGFLGRFG